ncbi:MAG: VOC family protein [Fimbriimonadaceae bacterium]|nr:VOC family protein [Fimbriimonadaceae bacterium]
MSPHLRFIDHVAIAVPQGQLDAHVDVYRQMGFSILHREDVYGGDQVREVLLRIGESDNLIQLLEPLGPDSPVAKQIEKSGGRAGLAHVAFRTTDIQTAFDDMKAAGFNIIDAAPRKGSRGTTVFFLHPKTHRDGALGVLYEIVQEGGTE